MIRRTRLLATVVVCCVALVLGACGGGDDPASSTDASGEPVAGGNGRILTLSDPRTLDPAALGNAYASGAFLGNALYGTLMTNDEAGEVQYSMAESFTTNDNGATFTLKLRPGLVFSDGTPLNAEAVKFNWDRIKDPAVGLANRAEASTIASSEVVDDVTLKVTLATPVPRYAQSVITSTMNWIASPAALEKGQQAFDAKPIGAGPFTLQSWTRQAAIELVKNPRYWDAPKPYLDRLTLRSALDASQRLNTVISGGADVAVESNWLNVDKATEAGLPTDVMQLNGGIYIALNMRRAPFDDIRARQAVAAALDLDALNLAAYNGTAQLADTLFTDASPFYSETPLRKTDRATAQRLFDELAAEGKPVSFTFTATPSTDSRAITQNVQAQLSSFNNVKVQIKIIDIAELAGLRTTHDFDATVSSAFFPDPEPRLWTTFHGSSAANLPGIDDPELNDALLAGRTEASEEERKAAYETLQQRLTKLAPVIFLMRAAPSTIAGKNVGGLVQYGLGSLLPEELWIQQ
ncbi:MULTISPECIES: ABC transporter substrate-binding protein [unclassified Parafrankia]|uniref:ABC transporter substrate-binding protein n=1 Tax=unclassified Parafrankia TaxID=2994368 RepID=UPI000DA5C68C|nr:MULTISPECIES: ABC transporter substrate-binding protein [unclassified Parafrankia]TCJ33542.1 ABC transporter substrate-binding protein [Parafrankia sp. BMG5.11]SQD99887.1 Extracellular solute-binding protein family 5 [Parafrankia sp. Ea1.12]